MRDDDGRRIVDWDARQREHFFFAASFFSPPLVLNPTSLSLSLSLPLSTPSYLPLLRPSTRSPAPTTPRPSPPTPEPASASASRGTLAPPASARAT